MRCDYYDAGTCRSCALLPVPYPDQLRRTQERVAEALSGIDLRWLPPVASAESGFRNKAKMVAGGTVAAPTLGILGPDRHGVDLIECGLHSPGLQRALPILTRFVTTAGLTPYSVPQRRGELKYVLATESPEGTLMVRWVLRSTEAVGRIRKHLPALRAELPALEVASVNLQPEHKAVVEGPEEQYLTEQQTLRMTVNGIGLRLRPQGFFQTNTAVAAELYRHARDLVAEVDPATVWDLYCGVGGFGLHLARPGRRVVGVESSAAAVDAARATADELGLEGTAWVAQDATEFALGALGRGEEVPDLVVVNPPRRGIGAELAGWLEDSGVRHVVYSSCHAASLARDLAAMPSLRPVSGRVLDMFPHTDHHEVLVLLRRD